MRKVRGTVLAVALALLAGGCFYSETPRIPAARLSQPADFKGTFWSISTGENPTASRFEVRPQGDGYSFTTSENHVRLAELLGAKVFLVLSDGEDNRTKYTLMQRRQDGTWENDEIGVDAAMPFAEQNLAYLDSIARRHGLRLSNDTGDTDIEGKIHGLAIPAFFSDRDTLAALAMQPVSFFLPARTEPISVQEIDLPTTQGTGGFLDYSTADPEGPVPGPCPADFAGDYRNSAFNQADFQHFTIRAKGDCRFEFNGAAGRSSVTLMPLRADTSWYVALDRPLPDKPGTTPEHARFWIVRRENEGEWRFSGITLRLPAMTLEIDRLRDRAMAAAALRQGFNYGQGEIAGSLATPSADKLSALFADGQFTSGLDTAEEAGWLLSPGTCGCPSPASP